MKLTKEEAIEILKNVVIMGKGDTVDWRGVWFSKTIDIWKQKGWIKKSKLEEARELTEDLLNRHMMSPSMTEIILEIKNIYEEVISELQDKPIENDNKSI